MSPLPDQPEVREDRAILYEDPCLMHLAGLIDHANDCRSGILHDSKNKSGHLIHAQYRCHEFVKEYYQGLASIPMQP
jgi:hypothetical protein